MSINDALLSYITYALQSGSKENIHRAVLGHFTPADIHDAKAKLWNKCDTKMLGPMKSRKGSSSRPKQDFELEDILHAITKLDNNGSLPDINISAMDLHKIPRSHPEELCNISVIDRLNRMEAKMNKVQITLDETISKNLYLEDKLDNIQQRTYAAAVAPPAARIPRTDDNISQQPAAIVSKRTDVSSGYTQLSTRPAAPPNALAPCKAAVFGSNVSLDRAGTTSAMTIVDRRKKQQRKTTVIAGNSSPKGNSFKGAPSPDRHLFIYRVDQSVHADNIQEYLISRQFQVRELVCMSNENARYKSFKLTVAIDQFRLLFDENLWPCGVRVRKFNPPRQSNST